MSEKYGRHPLGGPTYIDENGYVQLRKMEYDAEGTVGGAVSDPCNVQMVILTTPEDAGKGIEHAVKRVLGRTKEIALPFSLRIDVKPYMKFAQIRARWTEEVDSKQVQRIDQAPGNDSIRPGQLDPGPLRKEHIRDALERLRKQGTLPLLGSAIVYETTYYSLAADMYKEVIRGLESGKVFDDKHVPGRSVKGLAVCMGFINNLHIIEVYGVIEKKAEVEQ